MPISRSMRMLVVDDSAIMRTIVKSAIEVHDAQRHLHIEEAASAEQALALIREGKVDLMLVDWNMPRTDGVTLVRSIRKLGHTFPIIMVSAVSDRVHITQALSAGVTDYVTKPFEMGDLWSRILEVIEQ